MNANDYLPGADLIFLTLDSLRYDVAHSAFIEGLTPNFSSFLPREGWEKRYTPASFTFPAHHAFFSGFLPTKIQEEITPRLFAGKFLGSKSVTSDTFLFEEKDIAKALENRGYLTVCIGGVGFFNMQTEISSVLPDFFVEKIWKPSFGVVEPSSTENQFKQAQKYQDTEQPLFLFMNLSATHQPTDIYIDGATQESIETQKAALAYIDTQLPLLLDLINKRNRKTLLIICSDHGTAFGEDGHLGHRNGHEVVMKVPYFHTFIESKG